jgi:hypothetical protein
VEWAAARADAIRRPPESKVARRANEGDNAAGPAKAEGVGREEGHGIAPADGSRAEQLDRGILQPLSSKYWLVSERSLSASALAKLAAVVELIVFSLFILIIFTTERGVISRFYFPHKFDFPYLVALCSTISIYALSPSVLFFVMQAKRIVSSVHIAFALGSICSLVLAILFSPILLSAFIPLYFETINGTIPNNYNYLSLIQFLYYGTTYFGIRGSIALIVIIIGGLLFYYAICLLLNNISKPIHLSLTGMVLVGIIPAIAYTSGVILQITIYQFSLLSIAYYYSRFAHLLGIFLAGLGVVFWIQYSFIHYSSKGAPQKKRL